MKIKLTQEQTDFIVQTFGCKDGNFNSETEKYDSTYFQTMAFTQCAEDKGTCLFEMKHISELSKEDILSILSYIVRDSFPNLPQIGELIV